MQAALWCWSPTTATRKRNQLSHPNKEQKGCKYKRWEQPSQGDWNKAWQWGSAGQHRLQNCHLKKGTGTGAETV